MKPFLIFLLALLNTAIFGQTASYQLAWDALNENNRSKASDLLLQSLKEDKNTQDAYITSLYLETYNSNEKLLPDFSDNFYSKYENSYPYIYALWFNEAVAGEYGKKGNPNQLQLLNKILDDRKAPGTLVAAANYQMGMHFLFSNEFDKATKYYEAVSNIKNWQYTGPFENISESGFFKNYGPLQHPEPGAVFKSLTNADVKWFTPKNEIKDGWTPACYQFNNSTAIVYAQNFVTSAIDQTVYCNVGVSGSIKVWINDELVISERRERVTELDAFTVKCNLKKGINRILVQLGYSNLNYPNFNLRFTDSTYHTLTNINGSSIYAPYQKVSTQDNYTLIPLFAETFFLNKIDKDPNNLVNYLLLTDVYLRVSKLKEARELITKALAKAPDNSLLRMKLIDVLDKENNRTLLVEEIEKLKKQDPESFYVLDQKIKELFQNEKYDDIDTVLKRRIELYGEDIVTDNYKILLAAKEKKYDLMVSEVEESGKKYPDNPKFADMMYTVKKEVYKDNKAALKVYENFLKTNFDYKTNLDYSNALEENGYSNQALEIKQKLADNFPYSPQAFYELSKYFYSSKEFNKAEETINEALALSPYNETYWEQLGDVETEKKNTSAAMNAYTNSLLYNPDQYDLINKTRKLNGKSELYKLFPETDINKLIDNDNPEEAKNTSNGYYYILDETNVILYTGGATEMYCTLIVKIVNEDGVDKYKESSISYNNNQSLLIDKVEIIKKDHSTIEGERNENQIVFTNLEAGDVIIFKYRLQNYDYGRFAKDFWDKCYFISNIYSASTRYNLLIPKNQTLQYEVVNSDIKPVISEVEDFKKYSWTIEKSTPLKDEPLMPATSDIGTVLHLTTLNSWNEIANWYSDVTNNNAEEDFEIKEAFKKIFSGDDKNLSQFAKAKKIYEYLENNIRYSSVPFRQSNYVPQRPSETLTTRLGDCKDLSSLFVTLAQMARIKAQMVLVNTRDNGLKDILLPSMEFNHCIAKAILDNKPYYIELTDNNLPFASLPNNLNDAIILEVPYKSVANDTELKLLKAENRTKDIIKRYINIKPEGDDLNISIKSIKCGRFSADTRDTYKSLDDEKQMIEFEKSIAQGYKNNVKLSSVHFSGLDKLNDSVVYDYAYKVKNEVSEIGSIKTFKVNYPDIVATLDKFSADTRLYPIEYWYYEDADAYETYVTISAPAGKKFIELPQSESFNFKDMKFSITYTLSTPSKLLITRKYSCKRQNLAASDYAMFKSFFERIVKAEQKFIAFQ